MRRFFFCLVGIIFLSSSNISHAYTSQEQAYLFTQVSNNLLSLIYGLQPATEAAPPTLETFSDVSTEDWYYEAIEFVVTEHIMSGTSSSTFSPEKNLSRGILSTVITGAHKAYLGLSPNIFLDCAESWYRDSVNWCAQNRIMDGYSPRIFGGEDQVDREQLAVVLYGYASYLGLDVSYNTSTLSSYSDRWSVTEYAIEELSWIIIAITAIIIVTAMEM